MAEVVLTGCTPEPLMGYLKSLGIFRLVAEQADRDARGFWREGFFVLQSRFDRDELSRFFVVDYKPTPVIGPWGARSGFYPGSSESSAREALNAIAAAGSEQPRLTPFRDVIVKVRDVLARYGFSEKVRDEDKLALMRACRNELPDEVLPWLDAVFILTDDFRKFPPLMGTGGNEGSGSYVSTFAQVVVSLIVRRESDKGLLTALFGEAGATLNRLAVGHFNPGAIGGANSSQGFGGGGGVNMWDYLLAVEGCPLFAGAAARRLGTDTAGRAGYPFCVEAVPVGYASESDKEAGQATRAELWLPTWSMPIALVELSQLLAEGRAQLGRRQARNAVEFAVAACTLGVSRGITAFVRYAFVMRNGLSYFAAPLGRVTVTPRPQARLLHDPLLTEWLETLRSACRDKEKTPARYQTALRQIDRTMYEFAARAQTDSAADRRALANVLRAIGRAERTLANGRAFCKDNYIRPLQGFSPQWLDQGDDSPEFHLAASLAGIRGQGEVGPLRVFLEEVEWAGRFFNWSPGSASAVWSNRPLAENLAAVFRRRQLEAYRTGKVGVPLFSLRTAPLADVIAFLEGATDDDKLHDLIWGLSTLDWSEVKFQPSQRNPQAGAEPPFEFGVPRLLVEPVGLVADGQHWRLDNEGEKTKPAPDVFLALASARSDAIQLCVDRAARRLKSGGRLVAGYRNAWQSRKSLTGLTLLEPARLLAAMMFPLAKGDMEQIADAVLYPPEPRSDPHAP